MYKKIEGDLKKALYILHGIKIIHFDIKPENTMYSPFYNKFVFIDFGLAEYKNFSQSFATKESFKGTYHYCSDEMKSIIFDSDPKLIDVYYNDCYCLK